MAKDRYTLRCLSEDNLRLLAWIRPIDSEYTGPEKILRRVYLFDLGFQILDRLPEVTDEGKLNELLKKRIKPGTPRGCITPNGRRDGHGAYAALNDAGDMVCAFCQEPV